MRSIRRVRLDLDAVDKVVGKYRRQSTGYLFLLPAALFIIISVIIPLARTMFLSLSELDVRENATKFVGFLNYRTLIQDEVFWLSIKNTIVFTLGSVFFHTLIGGLLALILNLEWASTRLRDAIRGVLILPWLFSTAASALMWGLLYHPFGVLNHLLTVVDSPTGTINFLGNPDIALWSLIFINVWKFFPVNMVLILGGLQSIPTELYEAAEVDGASPYQKFRFVTLPLVTPVLLATITLGLVSTFGVYDVVRLMTHGGPFRSTTTTAFYAWQRGFRDVNFGYGAAISMVMLVILGGMTLVYLLLISRREGTFREVS